MNELVYSYNEYYTAMEIKEQLPTSTGVNLKNAQCRVKEKNIKEDIRYYSRSKNWTWNIVEMYA